MRISLLVLTSFCLSAGPLEVANPQELTQNIQAALSQLEADGYGARQAAMEQLWAAGDAAVPLLEKASRSKNAEVRYRAQFVLEQLNMGIAFDTPPRILREVNRFRSELVDERRYAMRQLEMAGRPRIVLALLQSETDSRLRDEWSHALERTLIRTIAAGRLEEAADTLRRAADGETWIRHWSAYAAQRGQIDTELARLATSQEDSESELIRRRVFLLRAKGEIAEACRLAEGLSEDLHLSLLAEQRDWGTAARLLAARSKAEPASGDQDLEQLSMAAAYFRLAGYEQESDQYLAVIKEKADDILEQFEQQHETRQSNQRELVTRSWHLAKGLLLNGWYDQAMEVMRVKQPSFVFELLCEQQRYQEAFASVGAAFPRGPDAEWFRRIADQSSVNTATIDQEFAIAQHAIRHLCFFGRRDEALQYLQILIESAKDDRGGGRLRMLCETATKLALHDESLKLAAMVVEKDDSLNVFSILYGSRSGVVEMWWGYFRTIHEGETLLQTTRRVDELLHPVRFRDRGGDLEKLVAAAAEDLPGLAESKETQWCRELAETCLLYHRKDLAMNYLSQAAVKSTAAALRLGDLLAADDNWSEAARWYDTARQLDPDKPLPLYLYARALQRSGQVEKGTQLAECALLMPMADDDLRHELATGLKERGYRDEAREQFELLLRTGDFQNGKLIDAAKQVGNLIHGKQELRAADCWETMLLSCLKPNWGFVESAGYIQIPQLVHKTRARGLLKAGKIDEAIKELWASYRAAPGDLELAEELIPLLDAASRRQEANELFARSANHLRELGDAFPQCATFHNNLAWLCARCGRELDEGIRHAERALELEPGKPSFIDTLGELYFRRGQFEQAVACAERCLKADPKNAYYHAQFDRFRAALKPVN